MKTILKSIITGSLFVVCGIISISSFSQTSKFKLQDLTDKTWSKQGLTDRTSEERFDKGTIILFYNKKNIGKMEYYLSDSIVKVFDSAKVGKVQEGKYLVRRPIRAKDNTTQPLTVTVYEIVELLPNKLVLRNSKNQLLEFSSK
jgi:hypothetical protein